MIGIFDSGIGGLTVVKEFLKILSEYSIIYFGDTGRTPYGNKSKDTILRYACEDTDFLISQGAKIIVVACNSASTVANELKKKYDLPIFEVIGPAVKRAREVTKNNRVGVIGTRATVNSGLYEELLGQEGKIKVFARSSPLLVPLVEEDWLKKDETKSILRKYLQPLRLKQIDTLILACTHYPLLKNLIQSRVGKRVTLVDPAHETASQVKKYIEDNPDLQMELREKRDNTYFISDKTPHFSNVAHQWLGEKIKIDKAVLG